MANVITPERLKIAWLTPLACTSAIGRYSRLVVGQLAEYHDVEAWTFGDFPLIDMPVPVRVMRSHTEAVSASGKFDVAVYQIGNQWAFHGEIMLMARSRPGIIVLHDYTIQHLIAAYCFDYLHDAEAYVRLMRESHGAVAEQAARAACSGSRPPIWDTDESITYPLTPVVTTNAIGVVAHSEYALSGVRAHHEGPAAMLPLPYAAPTRSTLPGKDLGLPPDTLLVVTTGHMNPNKRAKEVILALGMLPEPLKARVIYAMIGPVDSWYAAELKAAANEVNLHDRIRVEGYVDDARLHAYLERADLCVNLRYPNYEGASASAIEQLLAGKAVVASSTGSFAELPGDVVQHVHRDGELPGTLEKLLICKELREMLAARGQAFARRTFRADAYAAAFSAYVTQVLRDAPVLSLERDVAERARVLGFGKDDSWTRSVQERATKMFLSRREAATDRNR